MKNMVKLLATLGILFVLVFSCINGYAASILKKIEVELNTIAVKVGATTLQNDNIVYKGNIYIRADKVATALGKDFSWDKAKKTVVIKDKATPIPAPNLGPKYNFSNPAPLNVKQTIKVKDLLQTYTVEMEVKDIIRGEEAWKMIQEANRFNSPAKDGYEYVLAKIYFKVTDINEGEAYNLSGANYIKAISMNGKEYDYSSVVNPEPSLDANLYKGASIEGWQAFMVKGDDTAPKLAFGRDYNGKGGIWFNAYK